MQARQLSLSVIEQPCVCLSDTCSICRYSAVALFTWTRRAYRSCSSPTIRYNSFFSTTYLILYPVNPLATTPSIHNTHTHHPNNFTNTSIICRFLQMSQRRHQQVSEQQTGYACKDDRANPEMNRLADAFG